MKDTLDINEVDISKVGALLADAARAAIIVALCRVHALPASELAARAGISVSTTSIHLAKLMEAGWVELEQYGRHHYYRLTSPQIAKLLEQAMSVAPIKSALKLKSERTHHQHDDLRLARTCYDHLAGKLGVALTDALMQQDVLEVIDKDFTLTNHGEVMLQDLGVNVAAAARQRRAFARRCLDWTERRDHLGGALGAAICSTWIEQGWVQRQEQNRALHLTSVGEVQLRNWGITWTLEGRE
ncbi:MAG: ArsR/SmtB family transcription factor [Ktedonobacteraceae bacterium]